MRAYRLALWGLIPTVGAILGPVAIVLGLQALRKGKKDPAFTARIPSWAAVVLGLLLTMTQWTGLYLIYLGTR